MATATQDGTVTFNSVTSAGLDVGYTALFDSASGGSRLTEWKAITNNPDALEVGERYTIADDALVITLTGGADWTESGRQHLLRAALSTVQVYIGLSSNGTTEVSGNNYSRQAIEFTIA